MEGKESSTFGEKRLRGPNDDQVSCQKKIECQFHEVILSFSIVFEDTHLA